jgi:hypothetical protein
VINQSGNQENEYSGGHAAERLRDFLSSRFPDVILPSDEVSPSKNPIERIVHLDHNTEQKAEQRNQVLPVDQKENSPTSE